MNRKEKHSHTAPLCERMSPLKVSHPHPDNLRFCFDKNTQGNQTIFFFKQIISHPYGIRLLTKQKMAAIGNVSQNGTGLTQIFCRNSNRPNYLQGLQGLSSWTGLYPQMQWRLQVGLTSDLFPRFTDLGEMSTLVGMRNCLQVLRGEDSCRNFKTENIRSAPLLSAS